MSDELIESQRRYYDERAPDYGDVSKPSDRGTRGLFPADVMRTLIDGLAPTGEVLELACGPGVFTLDILRHARSVTALDASPRMLECGWDADVRRVAETFLYGVATPTAPSRIS